MEEMEQAQEVLNKLESEAERVGLYCNAKKTVFQTFNQMALPSFKLRTENGFRKLITLSILGDGHTAALQISMSEKHWLGAPVTNLGKSGVQLYTDQLRGDCL